MSALPEMCGIAFKEWSTVCDALAEGRQSLILRKGGVAEHGGPGRFVPEHSTFWLYPTWVHQAEQGVRSSAGHHAALHQPSPRSQIPIHAIASVTVLSYVRDEQTLDALERFHVLTAETVRKRFHYRAPGLWALAARVWFRSPGYEIPFHPEHAGCKTWLSLDQPLSTAGLRASIEDQNWAALEAEWQSLLASHSAQIQQESTHA